jgi:hypothetical protein
LYIKFHSYSTNKNAHDIVLLKYRTQYDVYHFATCFNLRNSSYIDIRVGKFPLSLNFTTHSCGKILLIMTFQRSKCVKVLSFNNISWNCVLVVQVLFNVVYFLYMVY